MYQRRDQKEVSEILPHLFLSGIRCRTAAFTNASALAITDYDFGKPQWAVAYKFCMLCDQNDESRDLFYAAVNDGVSFIEEQLGLSRDVIVYCGLGISRSASVVVAYVMKHQNMKFPDALLFV